MTEPGTTQEGQLKTLGCSKCGAPLEVAPKKNLLKCKYCGHTHHFTPPPSSNIQGEVHSGEEVVVEWGGHWWNARVLQEIEGGRFLVHYEGWSDSWDEVVTPNRVRPRSAVPASARSSAGTGPRIALIIGALLLLGAGLAFFLLSPSESLEPMTLEVGQKVKVLWKAKWYDAEILAKESPTQYKIHYTGWDKQWDEVVGTDRIRTLDSQ